MCLIMSNAYMANKLKPNALQIMDKAGAIQWDWHIASVDTDIIYSSPELLTEISNLIVLIFTESSGVDYDAVVGFGENGDIFSKTVAYDSVHRTKRETIKAIYVKENKKSAFEFYIKEADQTILQGKKVLIVKDKLMGDAAIQGVVKAVNLAGGQIIAVAVIYNLLSTTAEEIGVPEIFSLIQ